jgi:hypothetical protein
LEPRITVLVGNSSNLLNIFRHSGLQKEQGDGEQLNGAKSEGYT